MDEHEEQSVPESQAAHLPAIMVPNAPQMTDGKDLQALQVQGQLLPAPFQQITEANVQAFYANPANAKYIWSITHIFYERLWQLQDAKSITKTLLKNKVAKWFKGNTSIKSAPKNTTDVEAFSRFVVAFAMMTRDWKPPLFQLEDPHKAFDIPTFVEAVANLLVPTRGLFLLQQAIKSG